MSTPSPAPARIVPDLEPLMPGDSESQQTDEKEEDL